MLWEDQACQEGRDAKGGLRAHRLREFWQPLRNWRWFIVDDVEGPRDIAFDGCYGRTCDIVDMHEGPYATASADDGETPPAHLVYHLPVLAQRRARPVEAAVSEIYTPYVACRLHGGFEITQRRQRSPESLGRIRIDRIILGLYRASLTRLRPTTEALRDEPAYAYIPAREQQIVGSRGPQKICLCENLVEVAKEVAKVRDRGQRR